MMCERCEESERRFQAGRDAWDELAAEIPDLNKAVAADRMLEALSGVSFVKPSAESLDLFRRDLEACDFKKEQRMKIEYKVSPVTKWVITRLHSDDNDRSGGCETIAEISSHERADQIAQRMSKAEGAVYLSPAPTDD
jgi:hypothetical protein